MSLGECRDCGAKISNQAPACPHCGRPNPSKSDSEIFIKKHPIFTAISVVVLFVIGAITHKSTDSSEANASQNASAPIAQAQDPDDASNPAISPSMTSTSSAPQQAAPPVTEKTYKATISCTTQAGGQTMPHVCFVSNSRYGHDTSLKITANGRSRLYHSTDIMQMAGNNLALEITLPEHFELAAQNAGEYVALDVTIRDQDGKVVFQDQADRYNVIRVGN